MSTILGVCTGQYLISKVLTYVFNFSWFLSTSFYVVHTAKILYLTFFNILGCDVICQQFMVVNSTRMIFSNSVVLDCKRHFFDLCTCKCNQSKSSIKIDKSVRKTTSIDYKTFALLNIYLEVLVSVVLEEYTKSDFLESLVYVFILNGHSLSILQQ